MPFTLTKVLWFSASHRLSLPYPSKCSQLHGHNYKVTVVCASERLNAMGMVIDFSVIKALVRSLDHTDITTTVTYGQANPTAECIALYVHAELTRMQQILPDVLRADCFCVKSVTVEETEGNSVCYTP